MTDFFSMLAARAQPMTPAITPRKSARFEDPTQLAETRPELPESPPSWRQELPMEPAAQGRPIDEQPPANVSQRPVRSAETDAGGVQSPKAKNYGPEPLPPPPLLIRELVTHRETTVREIVPSGLAPVASKPPAEIREPILPRSEPMRAVDREVPLIPRPPASPLSSTGAQPAAGQAASPPPTAIVPRIELARSPEAMFPVTNATVRSSEPASPRIEVTIGTVEVRAVATAAPSVAVRTPVREPSPPLSLSDYLRQRRTARS